MKHLITSLLIVLLAIPADAVTNNVACDPVVILTAYTNAAPGDVIQVASGICTFSNITSLTGPGIILRGSGSNSTTFNILEGLTQGIIINNTSPTNIAVVSGLTIKAASSTLFGSLIMGQGAFHVFGVQMTNITYRGISLGRNGSYGLVDYCTLISAPGNPQLFDFNGLGYGAWTNSSNPLGTTNACYVENCYLDNSNNLGNGFFDAYDGAQLVFRTNYCRGNAPTGVHGYDSQPTSARTWEIYANILTNDSGVVNNRCFELRGGTGVVFDNQIYGYNAVCQLIYYRARPTDSSSTVARYGTVGWPLTNTYSVNFTNGQQVGYGITTYIFYSSLSNNPATYLHGLNGYGGGNVLIGATLAQSLTNLYNAVNLGTGAGTVYAANMELGHDFMAQSVNATTLILTNALDGWTDSYGYPANQMPGIINSYPLSWHLPQVQWPAYGWNNKLNGTNLNFGVVGDLSGAYTDLATNLTQLNRDYFNGTAPDSGTYTPLGPHPFAGFTGDAAPGTGEGGTPETHYDRVRIRL